MTETKLTITVPVKKCDGLVLKFHLAEAELEDGIKYQLSHSGNTFVISGPSKHHYVIAFRDIFQGVVEIDRN